MSAYIVYDEVVQTIANGFINLGVDYKSNMNDYHQKAQIIFNKKELITNISQSLINNNYRSVNYRYNEESKPHKFKYNDSLPFNYSMLYEAIQEYEYQACEPDDWHKTPLYFRLMWLKDELIKRLLKLNDPAYEYGWHDWKQYRKQEETTQEEPQEPEETTQEEPQEPEEETEELKIIENKEKNGIELYFTTKPDAATIATLKENRFKWNNKKKCWYISAKAKSLDQVMEILENL